MQTANCTHFLFVIEFVMIGSAETFEKRNLRQQQQQQWHQLWTHKQKLHLWKAAVRIDKLLLSTKCVRMTHRLRKLWRIHFVALDSCRVLKSASVAAAATDQQRISRSRRRCRTHFVRNGSSSRMTTKPAQDELLLSELILSEIIVKSI